jgi:hypothetical protein
MKFLSVRTLHFVATFLRRDTLVLSYRCKIGFERHGVVCVVVWLVRRRVVYVCVCVCVCTPPCTNIRTLY